MINQAPTKEF